MESTSFDDFSPNVGEIVGNNARNAEGFEAVPHAAPARHLAIVTCMDARIDAYKVLGLKDGEGHVIRNAGGVITDDVIRSLTLSQRFLGTREIMVIHHTQCGVQGLDDAALAADLEHDTGSAPTWRGGGFADPYVDVTESMERLRGCPFLQHKENISGFVYDVDDGLLHPVD